MADKREITNLEALMVHQSEETIDKVKTLGPNVDFQTSNYNTAEIICRTLNTLFGLHGIPQYKAEFKQGYLNYHVYITW